MCTARLCVSPRPPAPASHPRLRALWAAGAQPRGLSPVSGSPSGCLHPPAPPPNFWCRGGWLSAGPLCASTPYSSLAAVSSGGAAGLTGLAAAAVPGRDVAGAGAGCPLLGRCQLPCTFRLIAPPQAARPRPPCPPAPRRRAPAAGGAGRAGAAPGRRRVRGLAAPRGPGPFLGRGAGLRAGAAGAPCQAAAGIRRPPAGRGGGVPRRGGAVLAEEAGLPCVKPSPPAPSQVGWEPAGLPRVVCSPPHPGLPPSVRAGVWRGQEAQGRSWCCSCVPPPPASRGLPATAPAQPSPRGCAGRGDSSSLRLRPQPGRAQRSHGGGKA